MLTTTVPHRHTYASAQAACLAIRRKLRLSRYLTMGLAYTARQATSGRWYLVVETSNSSHLVRRGTSHWR